MIISPYEMNQYIATVIAAPTTAKGRDYPTRVPCSFKGKDGQVVLDQIGTIDIPANTKTGENCSVNGEQATVAEFALTP